MTIEPLAPRREAGTRVTIRASHELLALFLMALLAPLFTLAIHVPILTFVICAVGYLLVPGLLFQMAFFRADIRLLSTSLYAVGTSIAYWLIGGLALNSVLPHFGVARPLSLTYLLVFHLSATGILFVVAHYSCRNRIGSFTRTPLNLTSILLILIAFFLPFISLAGSNILNNSGSGVVTEFMIIAVACSVIIVPLLRKHIVTENIYPLMVLSIALSLLLMYSMRSWHVLGYDITNELRVFMSTLRHERWLMSYYPGQPYNACLSITVLPTALAQLFRMSPEYVFKLIYPVVFSVSSVVVYAIARRFLGPVLGFLAAVLVVAQVWYFEQLPAVARQEIGLVFFGLVCLSVLDSSLGRRQRSVLTSLFIVCLVLSHYSTAYVWLLLLIAAVAGRYVIGGLRKKRLVTGSNMTIGMVLVTVLAIVIWQGPVTHSAVTAEKLGRTLPREVVAALSPTSVREGLQTAFSPGPSRNTDASIRAALAGAVAARPGAAQGYYPPATYQGYAPHPVADQIRARDYLPGPLGPVLLNGANLIKNIVSGLFSAIGLALLILEYRKRGGRSRHDLTLMSFGAFFLMVVMLASPYLQIYYNLTRLYVQLFIILAIVAIIGFWYVVRRNRRYGIPAIGFAIAAIIVFQTGLLGEVAGGPLMVTMAPAQKTSNSVYVYDTEVAAARWLQTNRNPMYPVYADAVASLRLRAYAGSGIDTTGEVLPEVMRIDSYVYAIRANVIRQHEYLLHDNGLLVFGYPSAFLNSNKDLIYDNGQSQVYR